MNDIGPGDLVECIRDNIVRPYGETIPVRGVIYTVRWTGLGGSGAPAIRLAEIVNAPHIYKTFEGPLVTECCFRMKNFRPVRTTDISIFTKIDLEVKRGIRRVLEDA